MEKILIGHYHIGAYNCYASTMLYELTNQNIEYVLKDIPSCCPYTKDDEKKYKNWKSSHLPIVFFTFSNQRPEMTFSAGTTGYAVIDVDNTNGQKITTNHPSVCQMNHTGNGTHLFIHADGWGITPMEWQQNYNRIAYSVWNDLNARYPGVTLDGHNSVHYQGCYLWNTEWVQNPNYDRNYTPEDTYITDDITSQMYTTGTYTKCECDTFKNYTIYDPTKKNVKVVNDIDAMNIMSQSISNEMRDDFFTVKLLEFLKKYWIIYKPIIGTTPVFSQYTDYEGNVYDMYRTNGEMVRLWQPIMQSRKNLRQNEEGKYDYSIKEGGRKKSLYSHLIQAAQFLESENRMNPDHLLYDAVYWIVNYCENGLRFPKEEIMETVHKVIISYKFEECRMRFDNRSMVSGGEMVDSETGEVVPMDKGMKIRANAKCRKTERIKDVVGQWHPDKSIDWNVEHIKSWEDKGTMNLKKKTFLNYRGLAKNMPDMVEKYRWLENFEIMEKVGRKCEGIVLQDLCTGEVHEFQSKGECMEWLGIGNRKTFSKFLKGRTKFSKKYKVLEKVT